MTPQIRHALLLLGCGLLLAKGLGALEVPYLAGRVNDLAGILDPATEQRLETELQEFESTTGSQVVVLTIDSLEGDGLEDFAIRVVETWQLGREGLDDGVLLLVALQDRKIRIEVGYGLEGVLTDAMSRRIVDRVIRPRFSRGEMAAGVEEGVTAILALIRGEAPPPGTGPSGAPVPAGGCGFLAMMLVFWIVFLTLASRLRRSRHGTWSSRSGALPWIIGAGRGGGGFSSGGFGGFSGGGGSFGGGGASGSW